MTKIELFSKVRHFGIQKTSLRLVNYEVKQIFRSRFMKLRY